MTKIHIPGLKIRELPTKKMFGFEGMNKDAAKVFGFPWNYDGKTIIVDKNIHGRERARTELHEIVEKHYMDKGLPYWKAHKKATRAEKSIR